MLDGHEWGECHPEPTVPRSDAATDMLRQCCVERAAVSIMPFAIRAHAAPGSVSESAAGSGLDVDKQMVTKPLYAEGDRSV